MPLTNGFRFVADIRPVNIGRDRLVVRTSRCGRENRGSTPRRDTLSFCLMLLVMYSGTSRVLFFVENKLFERVLCVQSISNYDI